MEDPSSPRSDTDAAVDARFTSNIALLRLLLSLAVELLLERDLNSASEQAGPGLALVFSYRSDLLLVPAETGVPSVLLSKSTAISNSLSML